MRQFTALLFFLAVRTNSQPRSDSDVTLFAPSVEGVNTWQPFYDWTKNGPSRVGALYPATTIVLNEIDEKKEQLLIVSPDYQFDDEPTSTTWIFQPHLNSWIPLYLQARNAIPGIVQHYSLTTLCENTAVLFGGHAFGNRSAPVNDTWILKGDKKELYWEKLDLGPSNSTFIPPRYAHVSAPIYQSKSPCSCKESVLLFGGATHNNEVLGDLWEFRCVSEGIYQWLKINESLSNGTNSTRPSPRYFHAAVSDANKTTVYFSGGVNDRQMFQDIWAYFVVNNSWTVVSQSLPCVGDWKKPDDTVAFFLSRENERGSVVICCNICPVVFDVEKMVVLYGMDLTISGFTSLGPFPPGHSKGSKNFTGSVVVNSVVFLTNKNKYQQRLVWNLTATTERLLTWTPYPEALTAPRASGSSHLTLATAYPNKNLRPIMFALGHHESNAVQDLAILNLRTGQWYLNRDTKNAPPALNGYSATTLQPENVPVLVLYGGLGEDGLSTNVTWGFFARTDRWNIFGYGPGCRFLHSAVELSKSSLLVFGGLIGCSVGSESEFQLSDSLIKLSLSGNINVDPGVTWSYVQPVTSWKPPARFGHSAAYVGSVMIVYGGGTSANSSSTVEQNCLSDMWLYSSENNSWVNVSQPVSPGQRCYHAVTVLQFKMFLSGGCASVIGFALYSEEICKAAAAGLWLYDLKSPYIWLQLTEAKNLLNPGTFSSVSVWSFANFSLSFVVSTSGASNGKPFLITAVGCPEGYFASNFTKGVCTKCPNNSYSSHGQEKCTSCPSLLGTPSPGSASVLDCNLCRDFKYCDHGDCTVNFANLASGKFDEAVSCSCHDGYSQDSHGKCTNFLALEIAGGVAAGLFVITGIGLLARRSMSYKKNISETKAFAKICVEDIIQMDCVGEGSRGDVYKAKYGTDEVAVKTLQTKKEPFQLKRDLLTLQKEINILAKLRHPNVVVYYGWIERGKDNLSLVMKFYPRSLLDFLNDFDGQVPAEVLEKNKTQYQAFAKGIACGMEYLHRDTKRKPIIHRDLKPGNVLLSGDVVKIADFGCARSVHRTARLNKKGRSSFSNAQASGRSLTCLIGTFGYCAPEAWSPPKANKLTISTALDVFSYGMVLYKMWTLEQPMEKERKKKLLALIREKDHKTDLEPMKKKKKRDEKSNLIQTDQTINLEEAAEDAVYQKMVAGIRPTFDDGVWTEKELPVRRLIEKCWTKIAEERTSFSKIRKEWDSTFQ